MLPEKSPEGFAFISYLWVLVLAIFGGVVSYLSKLKNGRKWKWIDLSIEVVTAVFAAIITFLLCQAAGLPELAAVAFSGISSRFSDRAITLFGKIMDKVLKGLK